MTTAHARLERLRLPAVLAIAALPLAAAASGAVLGAADARQFGAAGSLFVVIAEAIVLSLTFMGGFVAWRVPRNPVGWLLEVAGATAAITIFGGMYAGYSQPASTGLPLAAPIAWLANWTIDPTMGILIVYIPMLFPTGRFLDARWRALGIGGGFMAAMGIIGTAFAPGPLTLSAPSMANPFALPAARDLLSAMTTVSNAALPFVAVPAVLSVFVRYRRAGTVERQQLKWFGLVAGVAVVAVVISLLGAGPVSDAAWMVGLATLPALPVAIGIAILRYRLWDIDRVVSRTIAWTLVTGLLAAVFGGSVIVLQGLLSPLTGAGTLAVAASTLVVFALFTPLRRRVQGLVDRRFDRRRYDAERTVAEFATQLRDELELDVLTERTRTTVAAALAPRQMTVWMRKDAA